MSGVSTCGFDTAKALSRFVDSRDPVEIEVDEMFDEPECTFHGAGNTGRCNHCEEDEE